MISPKSTLNSLLLLLALTGTLHAEESTMKGVKLGLAYDRGLGITGAYNNFNGFIGNDGAAVDYMVYRKVIDLDIEAPTSWYVSAGGFIDWDSDFGARGPAGAQIQFSKNVDAYIQLIPRLRVNNGTKFALGVGLGVRYIFD